MAVAAININECIESTYKKAKQKEMTNATLHKLF